MADQNENWKLLYDLQFKDWENSYKFLPAELKEKGYRLLTVYTAAIGAFAALSSESFDVMKQSPVCISVYIGIGLLSSAVLLTLAIIFLVRSTISTRKFESFNAPELQNHIAHEGFLQITLKHLKQRTEANNEHYKHMQRYCKRSLALFYSAVIVGVLLHIACSIDLKFSNSNMGQQTQTKPTTQQQQPASTPKPAELPLPNVQPKITEYSETDSGVTTVTTNK